MIIVTLILGSLLVMAVALATLDILDGENISTVAHNALANMVLVLTFFKVDLNAR